MISEGEGGVDAEVGMILFNSFSFSFSLSRSEYMSILLSVSFTLRLGTLSLVSGVMVVLCLRDGRTEVFLMILRVIGRVSEVFEDKLTPRMLLEAPLPFAKSDNFERGLDEEGETAGGLAIGEETSNIPEELRFSSLCFASVASFDILGAGSSGQLAI